MAEHAPLSEIARQAEAAEYQVAEALLGPELAEFSAALYDEKHQLAKARADVDAVFSDR